MPALVVLGRIPVPILAVTADGTILFANVAFADMLGHPPEVLASMTLQQVCRIQPGRYSAITALHDHAGLVIEMIDAEGFSIWARMSKSVLSRHDDPVALVTFHDLTEQIWTASATAQRKNLCVEDDRPQLD